MDYANDFNYIMLLRDKPNNLMEK